jgi:hypothetical protein
MVADPLSTDSESPTVKLDRDVLQRQKKKSRLAECSSIRSSGKKSEPDRVGHTRWFVFLVYRILVGSREAVLGSLEHMPIVLCPHMPIVPNELECRGPRLVGISEHGLPL